MDKDNTSQDQQNSLKGQTNTDPQNIEPQNNEQNIKENTYWENTAPEQSIAPASAQHPGSSSEQYNGQTQQAAPPGQWAGTDPAGQPQASQTSEQFHQYSQHQMNNVAGNQPNYGGPQYNQPVYQPGAYQKPPKKNHRGALIVVIVVILLLVAAAAAAYDFRDTLVNSFSKLTKSPAEYYSYIEKKAVEEAVGDTTSPSAMPIMNSTRTSYELTSDITVDHDTINSLLQPSLGMDLSDVEDMTGIKFDSIGLDAIVAIDGNIINEAIGIRLNQVNLITAELFMDTAAQDIFLRLPELSQAYLSVSAADAIGSTDLSALKDITPERTADFLKRYSYIIIENINQVELEDNVELSIDTLSTKCTKLTATITQEDAYNMVLAVLEEAREDDYILDMLPVLNLTKDEYQGYVDEAITETEDSYDSLPEDPVIMVLYVNSNGEIIGREFSFDSSDASASYTLLSKDDYEEYRVFLTDDTGNELLTIDGSHTKKDEAYTGDASVEVNLGTDTFSNISIDISYNDIRTEQKNNCTYQYGTMTLSSLDFMGLQVTMDFNVEEDIQKCKFDVQMGATSLVTLVATIKYLDDFEVKMPPQDAETYDSTQVESYLATFNVENYITNLSEQLGVDLQSIIETFMSGYYGY